MIQAGWWQLKYFWNFSSLFGEIIQFDEHMFQMGWNHQLEIEWIDDETLFYHRLSLPQSKVNSFSDIFDGWWGQSLLAPIFLVSQHPSKH